MAASRNPARSLSQVADPMPVTNVVTVRESKPEQTQSVASNNPASSLLMSPQATAAL
jgi:hypothetical protein